MELAMKISFHAHTNTVHHHLTQKLDHFRAYARKDTYHLHGSDLLIYW